MRTFWLYVLGVAFMMAGIVVGWCMRSWAGCMVRVRDKHGFVVFKRIREDELPVINEGMSEVWVKDPLPTEREQWAEERAKLLSDKGRLIAQVNALQSQVRRNT